MEQERHLGMVKVSGEVMQRLFCAYKDNRWWRIMTGVPEDAEFRGHAFDITRNCFVLYFEHPSFPLVGESEQITHVIPVETETMESPLTGSFPR